MCTRFISMHAIQFNVCRPYAGQLDAALAAVGVLSALLQVLDRQLATGGLDDLDGVGGRVVRQPAAVVDARIANHG